MADTFTTNLNLTKPEPGAAEDTWGISLNDDLDTLDAIFSTSGTQVNLNPNQVNFADNKKAIFGTGSDLQIYHDGSHSYIKDAGTGQIKVLAGTNFQVLDATGTNFAANFSAGGESQLYYNGNLKLKTAGSGIDVTGTTVTDGLTVNSGDTSSFLTIRNGSNSSFTKLYSDLNGVTVLDVDANNVGSSPRFQIDVSEVQALRITEGGDISFYDDTGTTQGLFWDASVESLGIGTTSPSTTLHVQTINEEATLIESNSNNGTRLKVSNSDATTGRKAILDLAPANNITGAYIVAEAQEDFSTTANRTADLYFSTRHDNVFSEKLRITSDGNVGIGTDSPSHPLTVDTGAGTFSVRAKGGSSVTIASDASMTYFGDTHEFYNAAGTSEYGRFDSSGRLLVGKTSSSIAVAGHIIESIGRTWSSVDGGYVAGFNRLTSDGEILNFRKDGTTVGNIATNNDDLLIYSTASGHKGLRFAGGEILPVSNAGALEDNTTDLGSTAYRFKNLQLSGVANVGDGIQSTSTTTGFGYVNFGDTDDANVGQIGYDHTSNYMRFQVNNTEKARIDSSGNLLVGKTAADISTDGIELGTRVESTADGTYPLRLNRRSSDGEIINFRKDGANVGSIGAASGTLVVGSTDGSGSYLKFGSNVVAPVDINGTVRDDAIDLGQTNARFQDLHLSGQANVGTINNVAIKANETDFSDSILISTTGATGTLSSTQNNTGLGNNVLRDLTTANNSTAIGESALANLTTGSNNTAIGSSALLNVTTASGNTSVGVSSLANNTAAENTAIGKDAARLNTTGNKLVAVGFEALENNTTGNQNTAIGYEAMHHNTTGGRNVAVGQQSLRSQTTATGTVAVGHHALYNNTTGSGNVAVGYIAMSQNQTGGNNTAVGYAALENNTGSDNTALGRDALEANTTGNKLTAVGYRALLNNTTGNNNVAIGYFALNDNTDGDANVAVGHDALELATASDNTAIGKSAGASITTGSNNTCVGYLADTATATSTNSITLGDANITTLRCNTQTISALSDARDKSNVEDLQLGVKFIKDLRPVSFTWDRRDGSQNGVEDFGFIAQELDAVQEKHNEAERLGLVLKDNPDKLEASYGKLVPMLVKAIQELSQEVEELKQKLGE